MKRAILIYGIISGLIIAFLMSVTFLNMEDIGFEHGMTLGYTTMIIAFSLIWFAVHAYKKQYGSVNFRQSFLIGLGITGIASAFYVITWLVIYYNFIPDFMDRYADYYLESMRRENKSSAEINSAMNDMNKYKEMYSNPVWVILLTLIEIAPVGIVITLITSLVVHFTKKQPKSVAA